MKLLLSCVARVSKKGTKLISLPWKGKEKSATQSSFPAILPFLFSLAHSLFLLTPSPFSLTPYPFLPIFCSPGALVCLPAWHALSFLLDFPAWKKKRLPTTQAKLLRASWIAHIDQLIILVTKSDFISRSLGSGKPVMFHSLTIFCRGTMNGEYHDQVNKPTRWTSCRQRDFISFIAPRYHCYRIKLFFTDLTCLTFWEEKQNDRCSFLKET